MSSYSRLIQLEQFRMIFRLVILLFSLTIIQQTEGSSIDSGSLASKRQQNTRVSGTSQKYQLVGDYQNVYDRPTTINNHFDLSPSSKHRTTISKELEKDLYQNEGQKIGFQSRDNFSFSLQPPDFQSSKQNRIKQHQDSTRILSQSTITNCLTQNTSTNTTTCLQCKKYFTVTNQGTCTSCGSYCTRCTYNMSTDATYCLQCQQNFANPYLLYNSQCFVQYSKAGFVQIHGTQKFFKRFYCPYTCKTCRYRNGTKECIQFREGYGFSETNNTLSMFPCSGQCFTCENNNPASCISCPEGYGLNYQTKTCLHCSKLHNDCVSCIITNQSSSRCTECMPEFYFENDNCSLCAESCQKCTSVQHCIKCRMRYGLLTVPMAGSQSNETIEMCIPCTQGCSDCKILTEKMICIDCLPGYFMSSTFQSCLPCSSNCQNCLNETNCVKCNDEYQLRSSGSCFKNLQKCLAYYSGNYSCFECFFGFALNWNDSQCVYLSRMAEQNGIVYECPQNQYLMNNLCYNSSVYVLNCIEYNNQSCIKCKQGWYVGYSSNNVSQCIPCPSQCKQCQNQEICTKCKNGYFMDTNRKIYNCSKCDQNCRTCQTYSDLCLSCNASLFMSPSLNCRGGYKFFYTFKLSTSLYTLYEHLNHSWSFADTFYDLFVQDPNSDFSMSTTDIHISTQLIQIQTMESKSHLSGLFQLSNLSVMQKVQLKIQNSIKNNSGAYQIDLMHSIQPIYVSLVTPCAYRYNYSGEYNTSAGYCQFSSLSNCSFYDMMTNGVKCKLCEDGYLLTVNGTCLLNCLERGVSDCDVCFNSTTCLQCKSGFRLDETTGNCASCQIEHCSSCELTLQGNILCLDCEEQVVINTNQTFIYKIINNTCQYKLAGDNFQQGISIYSDFIIKCMEGCQKCYTPYTCLSCFGGYFLTKQKHCLKCINDCRTCTSEGECYTCFLTFRFNQTNKSCARCPANCLSCSENSCETCVNRYQLNAQGQCVQGNLVGCLIYNKNNTCQACQTGFMPMSFNSSNSIQCIRCFQSCASCSVDGCTQCFNKYFMNSYQQCQQCKQNCWICKSQKDCQQCIHGFILVQNECLPPIQNCFIYNTTSKGCEKYFFVQTNNSSIEHWQPVYGSQMGDLFDMCTDIWFCDLMFTECSIFDKNCRLCYKDVCVQCSEGFYIDSDSSLTTNQTFCVPCSSLGCKYCQSKTICEECSQGYYIAFTSEVLYAKERGICLKCHSNCLTCYNQSTYCTSCHQGFNLTSSMKCVGKYESKFTLRLDIQMTNFYFIFHEFLNELVKLMNGTSNMTTDEKLKFIQIYSVVSGSTIVYGSFTSASEGELDQTVKNYENFTSSGSVIGIQIKQQAITTISEPTISKIVQTESISILIPIIIGIVGGIILLGIVGLLIYYFRVLRPKFYEILAKQDFQPNKQPSSSISANTENNLSKNVKFGELNKGTAQTIMVQPDSIVIQV